MRTTIQKIGLLIAMLFAILPSSAYDFEDNGVYYNLLSASDLTCEITYGDIKYSGEFTIPSKATYKGRELTVSQIGYRAFYECEDLTNIVIPECINSFERSAFEKCTSLTRVIIPPTVTRIGWYTFAGCTNLQSVELPNSITIIPDGAFRGCSSIYEISIPDKVEDIGDGAFMACINLQNIIFNGSVERIEDDVFQGCTNLKEIRLPESINYIGYRCFKDCENLQSIMLPKEISKLSIGMFNNCISLKEIAIPEKVTSIWNQAFFNCKSLASIIIPSNVQSIMGRPFEGCEGLHSIIIESSETPLTAQKFDGKTYRMFYGCPNVSHLAIGRKIGEEYGFPENFGLDDNNITKLTLLKYFCYSQFKNMYKKTLEEIVLTADLRDDDVPDFTLYNYGKLQCIICESETPPSFYPNVSNAQLKNIIIYVPYGSLSAYQNAKGWKNFWDIREMDSSGINDAKATSDCIEIARYNMHGNPVDKYYKGFVIVCYSDGSSKKVFQK